MCQHFIGYKITQSFAEFRSLPETHSYWQNEFSRGYEKQPRVNRGGREIKMSCQAGKT